MVIAFVITLVILAVIFLQDVSSRSIWWFLPALLFAAICWLRYDTLSWKACAFNAGFIALLMIALTGYIRLRWGKLQHPFKEHFGLGDLLFILAITPLLPVTYFVYYFTAGTFLALVIHLIVLLFRKQQTLPYAGYFALVNMAYLILCQTGTDPFHYLPNYAGLG